MAFATHHIGLFKYLYVMVGGKVVVLSRNGKRKNIGLGFESFFYLRTSIRWCLMIFIFYFFKVFVIVNLFYKFYRSFNKNQDFIFHFFDIKFVSIVQESNNYDYGIDRGN